MFGGKNIFSWNVPQVFKGDPIKFTQLIVDGKFDGVFLKACDGNMTFRMSTQGPWPNWGENVKQELVNALRAAGKKVYFWHFLYGNDPKGEFLIADRLCKQFNPDGYIWDVESIFDGQPVSELNARFISKTFRTSNPTVPQALCWWSLPKNPSNPNIEWHPVRVARAFMETVDCLMPMMYWGGESAKSAVSYLETSLNIWRSITTIPILPIGRAYTGDGGTMSPEAISAFANRVFELSSDKNLIGISWWALDFVITRPECWNVLKGTEDFEQMPISDREILKRLVHAHPELFPELKHE